MINNVLDVGKTVLEKHGVWGFVLFLFAVLLFYLSIEVIKLAVKSKWVQKKIFRKKNESELKKHPVFNTLNDLIKYKIDAMQFKCQLRKELFKDILKIKYQVMHDNLMELTDDDWDISGPDARSKWDSFFSKTQHDWVTACYAKGVPKIAISKYILMSEKTTDLIENTVEEICLTPPFSNKDNASAVFSLIPTMEISALLELNKTFQELNGELSGQEYKGISCKTCDNVKCDKKNKK